MRHCGAVIRGTDERGRFQFDRVIPGPGTESRIVHSTLRPGLAFREIRCWRERIEVKPRQTTQVTLGGKGRPVIGRFVLDGTPEAPVDWTDNEPVMLGVRPENRDPNRFGLLYGSSSLFATSIDKDGRFRIDDVPSGTYELELEVKGDPEPIGSVKMPVVVPALGGIRSNEPSDLGTITAKLFDAIRIGDMAADFDVERIGTGKKGERLKLSDYRGTLVLLNFWEPHDGQIDVSILKEVQENFGADPRFVLISLAWGKDAALAERAIKQNGLNWAHGFAGDVGAGRAARYKVGAIPQNLFNIGLAQKYRQIPLTFLIGPDGRILGHDLRAQVLGAVGKALEDPKIFPAAAK
jgi:hypothetical protein